MMMMNGDDDDDTDTKRNMNRLMVSSSCFFSLHSNFKYIRVFFMPTRVKVSRGFLTVAAVRNGAFIPGDSVAYRSTNIRQQTPYWLLALTAHMYNRQHPQTHRPYCITNRNISTFYNCGL
jgi:hypothetical protein